MFLFICRELNKLNDILNTNKFVATSGQLTSRLTTRDGASTFYSAVGTFTNNVYARPIGDNTTIRVTSNAGTSNYTLAQWQSASGKDAGSTATPLTIVSAGDLIALYNNTDANQVISLMPYKYLDVDGVIVYDGTITLTPFTGAVMIKNGTATGGSPITVPLGKIENSNILVY